MAMTKQQLDDYIEQIIMHNAKSSIALACSMLAGVTKEFGVDKYQVYDALGDYKNRIWRSAEMQIKEDLQDNFVIGTEYRSDGEAYEVSSVDDVLPARLEKIIIDAGEALERYKLTGRVIKHFERYKL